MDKQIVTLKVRVDHPESREGKIIDSAGVNLPTDVLTAWDFGEVSPGTLVSVTVLLGRNGLAVHSVDVQTPAQQEAVVEAVTEDNWVEGIYFSREELMLFNAAQALLDEAPVNLLISGPSGYGKTSKAKAWAKHHGMGFLRMDCSLIRDPEEWFGYREAADGSTLFHPTRFTEMVEAGNAVILLDEFNRAESWLANSLFPILDFERRTLVHGRDIEVGPRTLFIATANIGLAYVGTFEFDAALINRMDARIDVGILPNDIEAEVIMRRTRGITPDAAAAIVNTLSFLRRAKLDDAVLDVSTRSALKIAKLCGAGLSLRQAFQFVVVNNALAEDRKAVQDVVNSELGVL